MDVLFIYSFTHYSFKYHNRVGLREPWVRKDLLEKLKLKLGLQGQWELGR